MAKQPTATLHTIEGGGEAGPVEPNWKLIYSKDELDQHNAARHWREICTEMRQAGTLAAVNGAQIHRLVTFRIRYEIAEQDVITRGVIVNGGEKNGETYNLNWFVMRQAEEVCRQLEAVLGLSPIQRSKAGKIDRKAHKPRPADAYLRKAT